MQRKTCLSVSIAVAIFILFLLILGTSIPVLAEQSFGPGSRYLSTWQRFSYGLVLLWNAEELNNGDDPFAPDHVFVIDQGESVSSVSVRLENTGIIRSGRVLQIYLLWTGLDTSIQAGLYKLSARMSVSDVAYALQDATPSEVRFNVLAGWRMEEIAAALPTSGLQIMPGTFYSSVLNPVFRLGYIPNGASAEGFLLPGSYELPRESTADQLVAVLLQNFDLNLSENLVQGFRDQGLDVFQAVVLASIVERESIVDDEMATIASVFYNRLAIGMKLESDPTVQFSLGYDEFGQTWWTNPLTYQDLQFNSAYNTYIYNGLPPAPIANPGIVALEAVAFPASTNYIYFRARCDGSGLHNFAVTFDEHLQNACP
ncbi:MAG: endolytic transglycosylase MltG [Chloroflexota bacterium]